MIIKWLLEPEVFSGEDDSLIDALQYLNIDFSMTKLGKSYEDYISDYKDDCVVFHGSLQFARFLLRKTNWIGVYCNLPQLECLYYYPRFNNHILNSEYVVLPFGDLARRKDWVLNHVADKGSVFIRPSSGYKTFTGKVVTKSSWDSDISSFGCFGLRVDPESPIILAPPADITREWRTIVVKGKIIAGSQYKEDGEIAKDGNVPAKVLEYGQKILDSVKYEPDPAWTLDICETSDGQLKVLEVGAFSCSGFYECDPEPIIHAINDLVESEKE